MDKLIERLRDSLDKRWLSYTLDASEMREVVEALSSPPVADVERVARALCEAQIRRARKWDTKPDKLEAMLPAAIDHAWRDFEGDARVAIAALNAGWRSMEDARLIERIGDLPERLFVHSLEDLISDDEEAESEPRLFGEIQEAATILGEIKQGGRR